MSNIEEQREKLLQAVRKYKLDTPISAKGKSDALLSKRIVYIRILKKLGKYSPYVSVIFFLHYLIKKAGITAALNKTIVFVALSATTITGGYYASKYIYKHIENKIIYIKSNSNAVTLTERSKKAEIMIFSHYKNNKKNNITGDAIIQADPKELIVIEKQKDKIIISAEKNGAASVTVSYKDFKDVVHVISRVKPDEIKKGFIPSEKVYLKDGNVFIGRLFKENDFYVIITADRTIKIHNDKISRIEYIK